MSTNSSKMKQPDSIDVDQVSSFDDILQDLEAVKNQMKGPTTRAGTSVPIIIDENIIFQVFYQLFKIFFCPNEL